MLSTVGYTTEEEVDAGVVYSRSTTAWFEDRVGSEVSSVALGTLEVEVWEGTEEWSSVQKP
jgi:hypothetical protein